MDDLSYQNELAKMIKGISSRASRKLYGRETQDIENDLWVKVLEAQKAKGKKLDLPLAAKICWDAVEEMRRYDARKSVPAVDIANLTELEETNLKLLGGTNPEDSIETQVFIRDFCNQYPIGSKERLYLDFWGNASGAMPNDRVIPPETGSLGGYTETNLSHLLGYASQASMGYRRFKEKMQKEIKDYFNYN